MKVRSVGVRRVWDCMLCACVSGWGRGGCGLISAISAAVDVFFLPQKLEATQRHQAARLVEVVGDALITVGQDMAR